MKQKSIAAVTGLAIVTALLLALIYAGCELDIAEEIKAVPFIDPYISKQPASISYYVDDDTSGAALTVTVADWDDADGTLSFQWYKFDSYGDYLNGNATPIPDANSATFNPTGLNPVDGARYYYYVAVTNTNNNVNVTGHVKTRTINSETAIISFNAAGNPAIPIITSQPENVRARFGRPLNAMSIRAQLPEGSSDASELSYQWYQVDLDENGKFTIDPATGMPAMTPLDGETTDSFVPDPVNLQLGDNYFFVKVTHTIGTNSVSEFSAPAKVLVERGLRAAEPVIIGQPKAGLYFDQEEITPLAVAAESTDLGELSYQWYSNTIASSVDGTKVEGAIASSFKPEVGADQSIYYYVVVTNENNNVDGEKTAATASRAVNVRRTTAANASPHSTIQIGDPNDPDNRFNYIRGYGGMEVLWGNFPETYPEETELMYDPNKLGYNMLRIMIPPTNTDIDANMLDATTRLRPHYYDNVKIVNKHGGYVLASPWSPPKEWKSNNSVNGGGILRREYYQQFADYLKAFAQHMYNRGAPIYVISISNEPNYTAGYDGCEWEPEDTAHFFKQVGHFTSGVKGYGGGRQIPRVLVMNGESANTPFFNTGGTTSVGTGGVLMDPDARKYVDLFARHIYGNRPLNLWAAGWDNSNPIEIWMTEHNINSANATAYPNDSTWDYIWRYMNDVDLTMRLNNENAFVWWASKRFYSMVGDGQYGTPEGTALPRGWGLSHYSKYTIDTTRIGFTMTGTTADGITNIGDIDVTTAPVVNGAEGDMDNTTARITAYVSQDGTEISLVMWTPTNTTGSGGINMGTIQINMPDGFLIASATGIRSYKESPQRNVYHEVYNVPVAADRKSAYVTLPASELISVKFTQ